MRVLYVDVDSLRPDHLGCYGYDRDTSPNIDELAKDGRRFTNVYASDSPCLPSRTALFLCRFGIHTGVVTHGGAFADPRRYGCDRGFQYPDRFESWMTVLTEAGIYTASVSPFASRHDAWQVLEGVREFEDPRDTHAPADEIYSYAAEWLEDNAASEDWFLHVNFWDPHTPYNTPDSFGDPFADDPAPDWLTDEMIDEHYATYGSHGAFNPQSVTDDMSGTWGVDRMPKKIRDREDFKEWVDGYDLGVRFMDEHVGKLLDLLREAGVYGETTVVLSADHGENLGELNIYGDHHTADEHTCNVPLIISGPRVEPGVDRDLHYHLDLAPTITELAGGTVPEGWDGQSFAPALTDGASTGRESLVVGHGAWSLQRGVRFDDWLLLRTYHDGIKPTLDEVMLFDLDSDPHETEDLSEEYPEVTNEGLALLGRWLDDRMREAAVGERGGNPGMPGGVVDPMWGVLREGGPHHFRGRAEPYAEYLRSVGRKDQATEVLERYVRQ